MRLQKCGAADSRYAKSKSVAVPRLHAVEQRADAVDQRRDALVALVEHLRNAATLAAARFLKGRDASRQALFDRGRQLVQVLDRLFERTWPAQHVRRAQRRRVRERSFHARFERAQPLQRVVDERGRRRGAIGRRRLEGAIELAAFDDVADEITRPMMTVSIALANKPA